MFDALLLAHGAFDVPLPPVQPLMVQERIFTSFAVEQRRREGEFFLRDAQAKFDIWKAQMEVFKARVISLQPPLTPEVMDKAKSALALMEDWAEDIAIRQTRFRKRVDRIVKQQFKSDPAAAAVTRSVAEQYSVLEREKIESVLDMALFLRATNAMLDPESDTPEVFDDPDALGRALLSGLA